MKTLSCIIIANIVTAQLLFEVVFAAPAPEIKSRVSRLEAGSSIIVCGRLLSQRMIEEPTEQTNVTAVTVVSDFLSDHIVKGNVSTNLIELWGASTTVTGQVPIIDLRLREKSKQAYLMLFLKSHAPPANRFEIFDPVDGAIVVSPVAVRNVQVSTNTLETLNTVLQTSLKEFSPEMRSQISDILENKPGPGLSP